MKLFDVDREPGYVQELHEEDDKLILNVKEDVEPLVKQNLEAIKEAQGFKRTFTSVAQIPASIYYTPWFQRIRRDPKAYRKWLNDPDNRAFRTHPGRM